MDIQPVVYGSLAYAFYTNDEKISINDIDLLAPEKSFQPIVDAIQTNPDVTYERTTPHSLRLFRDNVKISLHSFEKHYGDLSCHFIDGKVNGLLFKFVPREALQEVYKRGLATIPLKKEQYSAKLNVLKHL